MDSDVVLVGVGGQGVLTIADLMTEAAAHSGVPFNYYPMKGMAQRGGFVKAQIRLGRKGIGPNIPDCGADLIIGMELSESLRAVRYVKAGGEFLLYGHIWAPTDVMLGKAGYPSLEQVKSQISEAGAKLLYLDPVHVPFYKGAKVPGNIYVLGAAMGHTGLSAVLDPSSIEDGMRLRWRKDAERNVFAFRAGMEANPSSLGSAQSGMS
jgi:indolepyruvate ferredoxin oxidoreductase beta subunit